MGRVRHFHIKQCLKSVSNINMPNINRSELYGNSGILKGGSSGLENSDSAIDMLISSEGEIDVMHLFIKKDAIVFDVGANTGDWMGLLLQLQPILTIHSFEPVPGINAILQKKLSLSIAEGRVINNCCGVGCVEGQRSFTLNKGAPSLNTFYHREIIKKVSGFMEADTITASIETIDSYCKKNLIEHIDFLKIDAEGGELDVLIGSQRMLKWGRIAHIQLEYRGICQDSGNTLREIFDLMDSYRYGIFKIVPEGLKYCPTFLDEFENYEYTKILAINERLLPTYLGFPPKMLNLRGLLLKSRIKPRGVIHIGAHEGSELDKYVGMGAERVLFIEANPETYQRLYHAIGDKAGVVTVNCAIANYNGVIDLHITSMDQSSSILPLKKHKEIYPSIVEEKIVAVPCRTLDSLMIELELDPSYYNILNIDIQGAEMLAFMGSEETLRHIEAINSEVNYEELYEGCTKIWELDDFLDSRGFDRIATTTPYHPSWGDGFYLKRPVVNMSLSRSL